MRGGGGVPGDTSQELELNLTTSTPHCQACFIYVGHLAVGSYFSHAETVHSLLLFDLSPFTS